MIREPEFAKRVASSREARNLSLSECARLMHVTRQQFGNWESGLCKPKGERMLQLAAVLQCDSVWLQHGESSELEQRIENVMLLMRVVVRDLDHIHKALGKPAPPVFHMKQFVEDGDSLHRDDAVASARHHSTARGDDMGKEPAGDDDRERLLRAAQAGSADAERDR